MKDMSINPGAAAVVILVVLLAAGGIWYFTSNNAAGQPAVGQAGRADSALSGPNSVMKGAAPKRQERAARPVAPR